MLKNRSLRNPDNGRPTSFLGRLVRDRRANVLPLMAALTLPLLGLIGSGIDISRAYMAKSRMQQACDSAALAGRRAMSAGVVDATVVAEAQKFFTFNFPQASYHTAPFTPTVEAGEESAVVVSASTTIPTSIMHVFGVDTLPLSVECNARQDFVNTDIVLVLDVTGSMDDPVGGIKKIVSLRSAVLAFYDELVPVQTQLEAVGLRLRIGVVPYSSNVNVGKLVRAVDTSYIVSDTHTYQSRAWEWDGVTYNSPSSPSTSSWVDAAAYAYGSWTQTSLTTGVNNSNQCNAPSATTTNGSVTDGTASTSTNETTHVISTVTPQTRLVTRVEYRRTYNSSAKTCLIEQRTGTKDQNRTSTVTQTPKYAWVYKPMTFDVSNYVTGAATQNPAQTSTSLNTWAGCIEERKTVSTITSSSGYSIPSNAWDLDIDRIPTANDSRWAPFWPEVSYRPSSKSGANCPAEAKRLQAWTKTNLETYLNSLTPVGSTYHDIGLIWGARFISPNGIFRSGSLDLGCGSTDAGNSRTYCNMPVSRFMIFMTDGVLNAEADTYTAYGVERIDQRVTGTYVSDTDHESRVNQRVKMMCNAIKGMNVSLWVVTFSTALTSTLSECASSTSQASTSANQAQLIAKFVEIGKNIGALRLTQ